MDKHRRASSAVAQTHSDVGREQAEGDERASACCCPVALAHRPRGLTVSKCCAMLRGWMPSTGTRPRGIDRRVELRREFLKGAGLWPLPQQGPYSVVRHSLRQHDGYTVENVALETLPGFYCTGNLYRPTSHAASRARAGHPVPARALQAAGPISAPSIKFAARTCADAARPFFRTAWSGGKTPRKPRTTIRLVLALQTWNSLKSLDFLCSLDLRSTPSGSA